MSANSHGAGAASGPIASRIIATVTKVTPTTTTAAIAQQPWSAAMSEPPVATPKEKA